MSILITGANRGIGHQLMLDYQAEGRSVIGTSRSGGDYLPLEVTDPTSHTALAETLKDKPIDLLVCNAGVYLDAGQTLDAGFPADMWTQTFAVNVAGVFMTIQALLPNVRTAKGKIAIISSEMASHEHAPGGSYIYRASKAAVLNLGRNLATDLRAEGIAVGIYVPGWVKTDMGGADADLDMETASKGLIAQFDALDMRTSGHFLTWEGQQHPF